MLARARRDPARRRSFLSNAPSDGLLGAGLLLVAVIVAVATAPPLLLTGFFHDDSFFYIKTAQHISEGAGSTFDEVNRTNGYHPLYMLLLVGLALLVPLVDEAGIRLVIVLDTVLLAGALPFLDRLLSALAIRRSVRLPAMMGVVVGIGFYDFGVEGRLLLLIAVVYLWAITRASGTSGWMVPALGVLLCLVRIDAILFVGIVVVAVHLAGQRRRERPLLSAAARQLAPALAVVAGYMAYNQIVFEHPTTISSWLKIGWRNGFDPPLLSTTGLKLRYLGSIAGALLVIPVIARKWIQASSARQRLGAGITSGLACHSMAYLGVLTLFLRGGLNTWYFALPLLMVMTCLAYVVEHEMLRRLDRISVAGLARRSLLAGAWVVLLAALGIGVANKSDNRWHDQHALGRWIGQHLPPDARIFQVDSSGGTAYFGRRSVINGDGLINGWEYQRYLRDGRLRDYLAETGVRWLIWDEYHGEPEIRIPVPLWSEPPLEITFAEEPILAARFGRMALLEITPRIVRVSRR